MHKDFLLSGVCSPPQSQRAQAPSLTGGHPRPTTVQHLTPQQLQRQPSGHRQAGEMNALHAEVMSCLGGLTLHLYCHGDNRQVMTSQLKKRQYHKLQDFKLWELAVKEILPDLCDYVSCGRKSLSGREVGEKVNPSVMWQTLISDWVTPNPYTAHLMDKEKTFSFQSGWQATRIMYVHS